MYKSQQNNNYNYLGAIHIHSKFSDGSGSIQEISKAAKQNGLNWIVITDHNSFDFEEGFYNNVCVIKGLEISPPKNNHYLALGINKLISPNKPTQEFVNEVRQNNGFGFAAHPDEGLNTKNQKRKNNFEPITWTDKNIIPDGVEIWNWFSQWGDNLNDTNIFHLIYAYLFKHNLVKYPPKKTLEWWDDLNNQSTKIVPAIGSVDAHAMKIKKYIIPVTIFPYKNMLQTITNNLILNEPLSKDFQTQKNQILTAIKKGNNIILNRKISPKIPLIFIENESNCATVGEKIKLTNNTKLIIKSKEYYSINVFHNGDNILSTKTNTLKLPINKQGKYRVELKKKDKGFAYTNPIIVN